MGPHRESRIRRCRHYVLAAALVAALGAGAPATEVGHTDGPGEGLFQGGEARGHREVGVERERCVAHLSGRREGKPGFGDFGIINELLAVNFWQTTDGSFAVIAALARDDEAES